MKEEVEGLFSFRLSRLRNHVIHADVFYGLVGAGPPMSNMQRLGELVFTEESWARLLSVLQVGVESLSHEMGSIKFIPARILVTGDVNHPGEVMAFQEFPERKDDGDTKPG